MITLAALALAVLPAHAAANAWNPVCTSSADPSVWFVFNSTDPKATPLPDYECKGLFFDTTACPTTLGIGKIRSTGTDAAGYATYELRYLPAGGIPTIIGFLNQPGGGVAYTPPRPPPGAPTAPAQPEELLAAYLQQRNKASAATTGVALNLWTCPDIALDVPDDLLRPTGMRLIRHEGKVSTY